MYTVLRPFLIVPIIVLCLMVWAVSVRAQAPSQIELQGAVASVYSETRSVNLVVPSSAHAGLINRAFNLHGGFKVQPGAAGANFTLRFELENATTVRASISSGAPRQVQFTKSVQGATLRQAYLNAADVVVKKITGAPGFFNTQIAFVAKRTGNTEVYRSDVLFGNVRQVTAHGGTVMAPHISPSGLNITYTSYHNTGFPDLMLANLETRSVRTLAAYKGINSGGAFSPTGRTVAITLSSSGNPELYVADINPASGQLLGKPTRLTRTPSIETSPVFSPSGARIVYVGDALGFPQLYLISTRGGSATRLQTKLSRYCAEPTWNPVFAEQIAFTAATAGGYQLAVHNLKTHEARFITRGSSHHLDATWLPDGRHLICTQRTNGKKRLVIVDSATGNIQPLHDASLGSVSQVTVAQ